MENSSINTEQKLTPETLIGCGLRDFFIARSGTAMLKVYEDLRLLSQELPPPPSADTIEFAFNLLFVGPQAPIAPPYASVYLEEDELLMSKTTQDARDLYTSLGLSSPWQREVPDDHISLEIDACLHMRQLQHNSEGQAIAELYQHFLQEHLCEWIPKFTERIRSADGVPSSILSISWLLVDWLNQERV